MNAVKNMMIAMTMLVPKEIRLANAGVMRR